RLLHRGLELLLRDPVLAGRAVLPVAARIALRTVAAVAAGCAVLARRARVALLSPFAWRSGRALGAGLALLATRAGLADDTAQVPHGAVGQAQQQMSVTSNLGVRDADAVCATLALRPRWPGLAFLAAPRRRLLAQLGQELVADLDTHRPQARVHGVHEPLHGGEDAVAHAATTFSSRARSVIACAIARSAASSSSSASSFGTVSGGVGGCIGFGVTIVSRRFSASSEKFCCCM